MTDYLQELHKLKLANEDHTTLLLNCYTKLKDEARLNDFLMQQNVEFDVDTAIKVLRQSGYYSQALKLCEKHVKHEDYLKIQLEHLHDYKGALVYIKKLDTENAVINIKKYGKLLILNIPDETVDFLKKLCSKQDRKSAAPRLTLGVTRSSCLLFSAATNAFIVNPTEFIQIFLKNSTELIDFLEHIHQVSR